MKLEVDVFSGILLVFLQYSKCCQFDLQFFCLLETQVVYLEVLFSGTASDFTFVQIVNSVSSSSRYWMLFHCNFSLHFPDDYCG